MTTKTVTTESGMTIKVELVREVQDKVVNLDGDRSVTGREIYERTTITIMDKSGKVIEKGNGITKLSDRIPSNKQLIEKGAIGRVGDKFVGQEMYDLIVTTIAELDAENSKSAEQVGIEKAKAERTAKWESEIPAIMESEAFERRMDDPNSDL